MRVEISLGFVVSLRPKGAAFGQAGSTRLDYDYIGGSFPAGPHKIYTNDLRKLDVHCRKLLRRAVGPPADNDWNQPWHTIRHVWHRRIDQHLEYHGVKMWSRKYLDEYCKFANCIALLDDNR